MTHRILVIPGDGIGAEVMPHVLRVLETLDLDLSFDTAELGGVAIDRLGTPLPTATLEAAGASDAVLLGAVGGPKWDGLPMEHRPEKGLLGLRAGLDAFANLRPAMLFAALADASSLHPELVAGLDILIVRELTGGIYFGEPRGVESHNGRRRAFNTDVYTEDEVERIARVAFDLAGKRRARLTSVDKANVLEVTQLWREVVTEVHADFPNIELDHLYVDNAAMQLVRAPKQFDVIVTGNLFGDILSDAAAMLTGSLGMLPSASLNAAGQGIYEPVHGSAPDIAGRNIANPLATILSAAMMLRYSLGGADAADRVESAVNRVLEEGIRTADIMPAEGAHGVRQVGTEEMADAVIGALEQAPG